MTRAALIAGRRGKDGEARRDAKLTTGRKKRRRRKAIPAPLGAGGSTSGAWHTPHHTHTHTPWEQCTNSPSIFLSYKESTDDDDEGEEEEGEENTVGKDGQLVPQEEDNREKIEKVDGLAKCVLVDDDMEPYEYQIIFLTLVS